MCAVRAPAKAGKSDQTLGGILQPMTHAFESAQKYGAWMMDPLPPTVDETKIYVLGGHSNAKALWMYGSYADFVTRRFKTVIALPTGVGGTGHVIYNGTIYYPQYNTAKDVMFRRKHLNKGQFSFGAFADIDLAADERGLWAVYTTTANDGYIVISKLHPVTLQ
ncbi:PREDICTED: noelin-like, partial [Priapulus caudatus]|uniref:Noelin-like n=1 Tax=Priapulus caudatus TaxID=37621 RepID=A0ABM1F7G4_PRICU